MAEITESNSPPLGSDESFVQWLEARQKHVFILSLLAAIFWTIFYLQFTVDDAFISYRYGKNLVTQHIWNWNLSGSREEAYTSALYTALSVIPALLHLSPALFFKFTGLACTGVIIYRLQTISKSRFAFLLGLLLVALHPWVWLHAFSGLETPLYILLALEMAIAVHRAPTTSPAWVYALFILLPLARPEGIVFACVGVVLFWRQRGSARKNYAAFALALALGVFYFLARWHYFQHFLPNPYYTKIGSHSWLQLSSDLVTNLSSSKGYFLVLLLITAFSRKSYTRIFAISSLLLLLLLYAPHDMQMNYADRFYFQESFPILLFFLMAEDIVPISRFAAFTAMVSLLFITAPYLISALDYWPLRTAADVDLGRRLAPFAQGHTILTPNAGAIPYYSNWFAYDFFGLGTYRVSHDGFSLSLLQEFHPDLILVENTHPGPGVLNEGAYQAKQVEIEYLKQSSEYEYIGESGSSMVYNIEFLRKDTPRHDEIVRALQGNMRISSTSRLSLKDLLLQRYIPWRD